MSAQQSTAVQTVQGPRLIAKFAAKFGVEPNKMLSTLKHTAFRQREGEVSNEQLMALLIVADQYGLNPWTKEIYAFPDKNNGIVPVVGLDGWSRIINSNANFDGMEFELSGEGDGLSVKCTIWRKDREHAISVTEYLSECKRPTQPWGSHPRRMLRHKAMIQCARVAFGYVGIYDEDEAERVIDGQVIDMPDESPAIKTINAEVTGKTTDEQDAAIDRITQPAATAASVGESIRIAKTLEALDVACDLIRALPEAEQAQLTADAKAKRNELTPQ